MGHMLVRVFVSGTGAGVQFDKKKWGGGGGTPLGNRQVLWIRKKRNADVWVTLVVTTQERYLCQM
jgi:hypothetical protein